MSLQIPLTAIQNNDNIYYLNVTFNGKPMDLTTYTPHAYLKASQTALDNTATVFGIGSGLVWVTQSLGRLRFTISKTSTGAAGTQWWHMDIVDLAGITSTVFYGPVTIKAI